jgi:hypothetical protein
MALDGSGHALYSYATLMVAKKLSSTLSKELSWLFRKVEKCGARVAEFT